MFSHKFSLAARGDFRWNLLKINVICFPLRKVRDWGGQVKLIIQSCNGAELTSYELFDSHFLRIRRILS